MDSVVIMEGDPLPGAVLGRMSFQSFNPLVDKLNKEAANLQSAQVSNCNMNVTSSTGGCVKTISSETGSSPNEGEPLKRDENGGHKRKQSEVASETQGPDNSPKIVEDPQHSPAPSGKGIFKKPKRENLDWNVLRPKK